MNSDVLQHHQEMMSESEADGELLISRMTRRMTGATLENLISLLELLSTGYTFKIDAIKKVRQITGCSLKQAKDFVDWALLGPWKEAH